MSNQGPDPNVNYSWGFGANRKPTSWSYKYQNSVDDQNHKMQ